MMHQPLVIITRPEQTALALSEKLRSNQINFLCDPAIRIHALQPVMNHLDEIYDYSIFISMNAVMLGLPKLLAHYSSQDALGHCIGVGPSTRQKLLDFEIRRVTIPRAGFSSEGVLALPILQSVSNQRVLLVKGRGGRSLMAQTLSYRGASVDTLEAYERKNDTALNHTLKGYLETQQSGLIVVITSLQIFNAFTAKYPSLTDHQVHWVVISQRLKDQIHQQFSQHVVWVVSAPDDQHIMKMIQIVLRKL